MGTKRISLHALEPDETLYERCVWLAYYVKDLQRRLSASVLEQQRLEELVLNQESAPELAKELMALRREKEALVRENSKLAKAYDKLLGQRKELKQEVMSLRSIHDHFQLPSAQA